MNFLELSKKLSNLIDFAQNQALEIALSDYNETILDLNKTQLFRDRRQADGNIITSTNSTPSKYSNFTEKINAGKSFVFKGLNQKKTAGEDYFLYDTGEFFGSFKLTKNDNKSMVVSALENRGRTNMESEYGANILGINTENSTSVSHLIAKKLTEVLKDYF